MKKAIWSRIWKMIYGVFSILSVMMLIMYAMKIEGLYVLPIIKCFLVFLCLFIIYAFINLVLNVKKLIWNIIKKLLIRFVIASFGLWAVTVLLLYLTKGELRLVDKIISSITIAFGYTFGELMLTQKYEK